MNLECFALLKRTSISFLFFIFLSAGNLFSQEENSRNPYMRGDLPKRITVVKTDTPPVIDGNINPDEWANAATVTGLSQVEGMIRQFGIGWPNLVNMASHQSTFWITYDDDNLYIAHHSPPPPEIKELPAIIAVMLRQTQTHRDSNLDWDDVISISIIDPLYPGGDKYVIQVNSIGTTFECIWNMHYTWEPEILEKSLGNVPGTTISWDPEIKNTSTLTLDGWSIELSIPWTELGPHIQKPSEGEIKYMNFGRIWQEIMQESHAWKLHDGASKQMSPAGEVVFAGDEGLLVRLNDTGSLPRGRASFSADIKNLYSTTRKVVAEVSTDSGELSDFREISLAPGAEKKYTFEAVISDHATTSIVFRVKDADTGNDAHVTALPVIRPTRPDFYIRRYRSRELASFEIDMVFIGAVEPSDVTIDMSITRRDTGDKAMEDRRSGFASYEPVIEISTEGLEPGIYDTHFRFSAPNMKPYEASIEFEHPELPVWWNSRYGLEDMDNDKVPYPWTDMSVEDNIVKVLGRQYNFNERLLPAQITTLGRPVLRGPMRIIARTSGGEVIDSATADSSIEWTKIDRTRVEGRSDVNGESFGLANSIWAEYDGIVWNSVSIEPREKVVLESMVLEIPLTPEFTDVINTYDYSLRGTGLLKEEGYTGPVASTLWLGNADGGLQWICETDGPFFVEDLQKVVRVEKRPEGATLIVTMIDLPTEFTEPHAMDFGLMATPVRPKTWRTPEFVPRAVHGGGSWYPEGLEFVPAPDIGRAYYGMHGRIYVHINPVNVSPEAMALDKTGTNDYLFVDEWRVNRASRDLVRINATQQSPTFRDYFVWRHWNYQQKYGFTGLYYDMSNEMISANPMASAGYKRRDGSYAPVRAVLGTREMQKRLYNIALSNRHFGAREQAIGQHQSGQPNMAFMGFGTYHWDAENYNSIINANQPTYLGVTDPAMYRAQHMGHNLGLPNRFLGQSRIPEEWVDKAGGPEAVYDHLSGLAVLHDAAVTEPMLPCCVLRGAQRGVQNRLSDALNRHNFYHWKYQFTPYWHQDIIKLPAENMYASFYTAYPSRLTATDPLEHMSRNMTFRNYFKMTPHLPFHMVSRFAESIEKERKYLENLRDKAIMIIYNDTEWEGEMRLKPDWNKLGLGSPENLKAENAVHSTGFRVEKTTGPEGNEIEKGVFFDRPEEYARVEDGEIVFPMTRYNYRMIVIEKK